MVLYQGELYCGLSSVLLLWRTSHSLLLGTWISCHLHVSYMERKLSLAWLNPLLLSYWKRNNKQIACGLGQYNQKSLPLPFMPQKLGHTGKRPATAFKVTDKRSFTLNKKYYINNWIQKHILLLENIKICLSWINLRQLNQPLLKCTAEYYHVPSPSYNLAFL